MTTWTEGNVTANGVKIHYYRTGNGDEGKPAMLMLHGITDNGLCWSRVANDLQDRYDIIMTDARGHGKSERLGSDFSVPLLAGDHNRVTFSDPFGDLHLARTPDSHLDLHAL